MGALTAAAADGDADRVIQSALAIERASERALIEWRSLRHRHATAQRGLAAVDPAIRGLLSRWHAPSPDRAELVQVRILFFSLLFLLNYNKKQVFLGLKRARLVRSRALSSRRDAARSASAAESSLQDDINDNGARLFSLRPSDAPSIARLWHIQLARHTFPATDSVIAIDIQEAAVDAARQAARIIKRPNGNTTWPPPYLLSFTCRHARLTVRVWLCWSAGEWRAVTEPALVEKLPPPPSPYEASIHEWVKTYVWPAMAASSLQPKDNVL